MHEGSRRHLIFTRAVIYSGLKRLSHNHQQTERRAPDHSNSPFYLTPLLSPDVVIMCILKAETSNDNSLQQSVEVY